MQAYVSRLDVIADFQCPQCARGPPGWCTVAGPSPGQWGRQWWQGRGRWVHGAGQVGAWGFSDNHEGNLNYPVWDLIAAGCLHKSVCFTAV